MRPIKLAYAPTRRSIFSAPDAVKYRNLTAQRLRELGVDFVDIDDINEEGLLYSEEDRLKMLAKFRAAGVDGLLLAPGAGQTLAQYGEILSGAVPEILPCIGCTQPGKWHCYDVWQHSAAAVGALDLRGQDTRGVRVLCWATVSYTHLTLPTTPYV